MLNRPKLMGWAQRPAVGGGPTALFDFTTGSLPTGIAFTRASTGSYYNSSGVLSQASANTPRFDYNPNTLSLNGLLIEEARTNQCVPSIPDSTWGLSNVTNTQNSAVSPDGTTSATLVTTQSNGVSNFEQENATLASFVSGTTYAFSGYFKAGSEGVIQITFPAAAFNSSDYANFNLSTGATSVSNGAVIATTQQLPSGWWRCTATRACVTTASGGAIIVASCANTMGAPRLPGSTAGLTFYMWGIQCEASNFSTSYIPTTSTAVTRAADGYSSSNVSWINTAGWSIVTQLSFLGLDVAGTQAKYFITTGNYGQLYNGSVNGFSTFINGGTPATTSQVITPGTVYKHGSVIQSGNVLNSVNASTPMTSAGTFTETTPTSFFSAGGFNGWIRKISGWNSALSSSALIAATT